MLSCSGREGLGHKVYVGACFHIDGCFATMQRCSYEPGFHVLVVFKGFFSV